MDWFNLTASQAETVCDHLIAETDAMDEAEGYAASLRQMAYWVLDGSAAEVDECELNAAAEFIERQQAEIKRLQEIEWMYKDLCE